jgi:hypothetical protein
MNEFTIALVQNPELFRVYIRGLADPDSLSPEETLKFDRTVAAYWTRIPRPPSSELGRIIEELLANRNESVV